MVGFVLDHRTFVNFKINSKPVARNPRGQLQVNLLSDCRIIKPAQDPQTF